MHKGSHEKKVLLCFSARFAFIRTSNFDQSARLTSDLSMRTRKMMQRTKRS